MTKKELRDKANSTKQAYFDSSMRPLRVTLYALCVSQRLRLSLTMALVKRLSKYWSSVSFGLILLVVDGFSSTTVNPYNFEFVINQPRCESDVRLLVVVHSSPKVCMVTLFIVVTGFHSCT